MNCIVEYVYCLFSKSSRQPLQFWAMYSTHPLLQKKVNDKIRIQLDLSSASSLILAFLGKISILTTSYIVFLINSELLLNAQVIYFL